MEEPEEHFETHFAEIPKAFYSEATGKPFEQCSVCGKNLLKPGNWYMVEKAVKRYPKFNHQDVIFEYAICMECGVQMQEKLSKESKQRIQAYFNERVDFQKRAEALYAANDFGLDSWAGRCIATGKPLVELTEHQMVATFNGNRMAYTQQPMMISAQAADEIVQLLSNHSLDIMNGFKDDITGMPPDLRELFKETNFMVV